MYLYLQTVRLLGLQEAGKIVLFYWVTFFFTMLTNTISCTYFDSLQERKTAIHRTECRASTDILSAQNSGSNRRKAWSSLRFRKSDPAPHRSSTTAGSGRSAGNPSRAAATNGSWDSTLLVDYHREFHLHLKPSHFLKHVLALFHNLSDVVGFGSFTSCWFGWYTVINSTERLT